MLPDCQEECMREGAKCTAPRLWLGCQSAEVGSAVPGGDAAQEQRQQASDGRSCVLRIG